MASATRKCRERMFSNSHNFNGEFNKRARENACDPYIVSLVDMITGGSTNVDSNDYEARYKVRQATLNISELLDYNSVKQKLRPDGSYTRHPEEKETPLVIYLAFKVYGAIHCASLVDKLHSLGLCISYKCMCQISRDIANAVIALFEADEAPCIPVLRSSLLTIGAWITLIKTLPIEILVRPHMEACCLSYNFL